MWTAARRLCERHGLTIQQLAPVLGFSSEDLASALESDLPPALTFEAADRLLRHLGVNDGPIAAFRDIIASPQPAPDHSR